MLNGIEAVIFDLDGSLVDSMWIWRDIDIEYLARFDISLPDGLQASVEGKSFTETAIYFKERFGMKDSVEKIKAEWNKMARHKYMYEVPLKEGAYDFLCDCKKNKIKMGIATSNSRELVEEIAKVHNLRDFFTSIKTGCDVDRGKPSPDIYFAVSNELNVQPDKCLVFEDVIPGIMAGKNAGMKVCAVEDPYSAHDRAEKKRLADFYIDNFYGLFSKNKRNSQKALVQMGALI